MSDNSIIEKIRAGDDKALEETYQSYRSEFIGWAQKTFGCNSEDAKEAYQVSFFIFYDKVLSGNLLSVTSSLKTYLFAIGKNKIFEQNRYNAKNQNGVNEENMKSSFLQAEGLSAAEDEEQKYQRIEKGLEQIGSPCREILEMVYYEKRSMDYITEKIGYKNATTTKNQKYKCMQRLKKIVGGIKL